MIDLSEKESKVEDRTSELLERVSAILLTTTSATLMILRETTPTQDILNKPRTISTAINWLKISATVTTWEDVLRLTPMTTLSTEMLVQSTLSTNLATAERQSFLQSKRRPRLSKKLSMRANKRLIIKSTETLQINMYSRVASNNGSKKSLNQLVTAHLTSTLTVQAPLNSSKKVTDISTAATPEMVVSAIVAATLVSSTIFSMSKPLKSLRAQEIESTRKSTKLLEAPSQELSPRLLSSLFKSLSRTLSWSENQ